MTTSVLGRIGVDLKLEDWDKIGNGVPCLVNLAPAGKYLMEDFHYAGGKGKKKRTKGRRKEGKIKKKKKKKDTIGIK